MHTVISSNLFSKKLPIELVYCIFDRLTKAEAIKLSCTNRYFKSLFTHYVKTLTPSEQAIYDDLSYEIFRSRVGRQRVYTWHLLSPNKPLCDLNILFNINQDKIVSLMKQGLVDIPSEYPVNVSVPYMKRHLPRFLFFKIWAKRFQVPNVVVRSPPDKLIKYKDDTDKNHFSAMTKAVLILFKDELVINNRFLRLLAFHELHSAFISLVEQRDYHRLDLFNFLPYIILFPEGLCKDILSCIGKHLQVPHYTYLYKYMTLDMIMSLTQVWKNNQSFQLFLRTLDGMKDYDYLMWLKRGKGQKYILPIT